MSEDLINEFLVESADNLDRLDRDLVELEKDPRDAERLASIFRTIHTIKGTCGFLAFSKLESISHAGESLLAKLRDGTLGLDAEITTALLTLVDAVREILASIERTGGEGDGDYSAIITELTRLTEAGTPAVDRRPERRRATRRVVDERGAAALTDASLRIEVALLDKLMNLVSELTAARNQILQFTAMQNDTAFLGATERLSVVTSELQEGVMKTRMQPLGSLWDKFPRMVRDLATQCGKQVRIEADGHAILLDKTIIEALKDPLTHVVRNCVDHGIEPVDTRARLGKPPEGVIRLRAQHGDGQLHLEISDDGAGIHPSRVRDKAVQQGVIASDQADAMPDRDLLRLVFLPGLSTAEKLTNLSGRGVGMDVVKTNIERIGGQVDIQSTVGEGTMLTITIPIGRSKRSLAETA